MKKLVCLLLLSGCSYYVREEVQPIPIQRPLPQQIQVFEPPPPAPCKVRPTACLEKGDCLDISLFGEKEMDAERVLVAPDGFIYYAMTEIRAEDQSLSELRQKLKKELEQYFIEPKVVLMPEAKESFLVEKPLQIDNEEIAQKIFEQTGQTNAHQKGTYRLQTGDQLLVAVYGEPSTKQRVEVEPNGSLFYLYLEPIQASGKTISQLRHQIERQFKQTYKYPLVMITLYKL